MTDRRLLRDRRALAGTLVLAVAITAALGAPWFAGDPGVPAEIVTSRFLPPLTRGPDGLLHLLGTDRLGRDVLALLLFGARVSLGVGIVAMLVSVLVGVAVGAAAGFWPRRAGPLLLGLTDFVLALPRVVLLLILVSIWQPSAGLVIVVLGLTGWMSIARLVQAEVRALAARPFVESARALGQSDLRLLGRHLLPNALTPVIVAASLGVGNTILLETGLSFLGLGIQPPTPSWGNLIASGRDTLVNAPWVATAPGLALVLVVIASTLLGDALRDHLDPSRAG